MRAYKEKEQICHGQSIKCCFTIEIKETLISTCHLHIYLAYRLMYSITVYGNLSMKVQLNVYMAVTDGVQ